MARQNQNGTQRPRWLEGRYGVDELNRFLSIAAVIAMISALVNIYWNARPVAYTVALLALGMAVWSNVRTFSRNFQRRTQENLRYLAIRSRVTGWFGLQRDRFRQRRDHAFYRCPGCRQVVRVPKGKGRIRITCPKCGYAFERRT